MFDLIRLVDSEKGRLLECQPDGHTVQTDICCTDVLGSNERCKNCTPSRAYYANETVVKLEYADGTVFLIFSVPLEVDGSRVVADLGKDLTKSMTVNMDDAYRENEITGIIDNLNKMATMDALTQLYNRRYLDETFPKLVKMSLELGRPLSVALLDLDDFKAVNDTYGHAAGDEVLKKTGEILSSNIRRGADWVARFGGEEFMLCFPGTPADAVFAVVERIRMQITDRRQHTGEDIRNRLTSKA